MVAAVTVRPSRTAREGALVAAKRVWSAQVSDRHEGKQAGASRAFTLGLTTVRLDKIAVRIRTAIAELREVDERYDGYGKQTTHGNTPYPAFTIRVKAGQASRPRHPERGDGRIRPRLQISAKGPSPVPAHGQGSCGRVRSDLLGGTRLCGMTSVEGDTSDSHRELSVAALGPVASVRPVSERPYRDSQRA